MNTIIEKIRAEVERLIEETEKWHSYAGNLEERCPFGWFIGTFNSHEQACEAAIKYCLENLI